MSYYSSSNQTIDGEPSYNRRSSLEGVLKLIIDNTLSFLAQMDYQVITGSTNDHEIGTARRWIIPPGGITLVGQTIG
jgi:hypothetical protein